MRSTRPMTLITGLIALLAISGCASPAAWKQAEKAPVPEDEEAVQPLKAGQQAPPAMLRTPEGETFNLSAAYSEQPTALILYRGGWCPYCTTAMGEVAKAEERLVEMGYQVFAVSPDRPGKLQETLAENDFAYRLLSDSDMLLARRLGVAFIVDEQTRQQYEEFGIDLVEAAGEDHYMLPVPSVFLIDRQGVIRYAHWDADYRERLDADELVEAAEAALKAAAAAEREAERERRREINRPHRRIHHRPAHRW